MLAKDGASNTGGGGGGASVGAALAGGNGGSGIVVIRYPLGAAARETTAVKWYGQSGSEIEVTFHNDPTFHGQTTGSYVEFDGKTQHATLPSVAGVTDFTAADGYSVAFWVWISPSQRDTNDEVSLVEKWSTASGTPQRYPYAFRYRASTSEVIMAVYDGVSNPSISAPVVPDRWVLVVGVVDPSASLELYIDGTAKASLATSIGGPIANEVPVHLMQRGGGAFPATGRLHYFNVFPFQLTPSQVSSIYSLSSYPRQAIQRGAGALDDAGLADRPVGAYALRRLFQDYTGPQVRIRRGSDDAETNVYFDRQGTVELVEGDGSSDVAGWLSGATGYVTTWFDQSGNGRNMSETTYQPMYSPAENAIRFLASSSSDGQQIFTSSMPDMTEFETFVDTRWVDIGSANRSYEKFLTFNEISETDNPYDDADGFVVMIRDFSSSLVGFQRAAPASYFYDASQTEYEVHNVSWRGSTGAAEYLVRGDLKKRYTFSTGAVRPQAFGLGLLRQTEAIRDATVRSVLVFSKALAKEVRDSLRTRIQKQVKFYRRGALDDVGLTNKPVAAYSLRWLFREYTGPQVRIRRSSDDVEADMFFDESGVAVLIQDGLGDTARDLDGWLGGATAYVVAWYDQSGTGNHTTNTASSQPTMVVNNSGRFQGRRGVFFGPSTELRNESLQNFINGSNQPHTIYAPFDYDSGVSRTNLVAIGNPVQHEAIAYHPDLDSTQFYYFYANDLKPGSPAPLESIVTLRYRGSPSNEQTIWLEGSKIGQRTASSINTPTNPIFRIGRWSERGRSSLIGHVYEMVVWSVALSDADINSVYKSFEGV